MCYDICRSYTPSLKLKHINRKQTNNRNCPDLGYGYLYPKDTYMFFNAIPKFNFSSENIASHALNIKLLSEWISFKECHLGLSHCREITAIAFGFKTLQELNEHLKFNDLSSLSISDTLEHDITQALIKHSKPLHFMSLEDDDVQDVYSRMLSVHEKDEEHETELQKCKNYWQHWHEYFAKFIGKYFKETHGNFEFFESLELISSNCLNKNKLALGNGANSNFSFFEIALYNHLHTQYVGDYQHCRTVKNKLVLYDNHLQIREYYISSKLYDYLNKNYQKIDFLKSNLADENESLFIEYSHETNLAKLNLILCKTYTGHNYYCPTNITGDVIDWANEFKAFTFNLDSYKESFSLTLPRYDDCNFMNQMRLNEIVLDQNDFVLGEVSFAHVLQKLREHGRYSYISDHHISEYWFDLKDEDKDFFDVTNNSFKVKDTFKVKYLFNKAISTPQHHLVNGEIAYLQHYIDFLITSHVYATVEISIVDSKIKIDFQNIKTKLSKVFDDAPVHVKLYAENIKTGETHLYKNEDLNLRISGLQNRKTFKKMIDNHLYIGPYKQKILKDGIADIFHCHQTAKIYALAPALD